MNTFLIVTILIFVCIGVAAWLMFKNIDDRYK